MTFRWLPLALLVAAVTNLASPVRSQPAGGSRDRIVYLDRKEGKTVTIDTEVRKESASGIEIPEGKGVRLIPPSEIVRVDYGGLPGVTRTDVNTLQLLEDSGDFTKARSKYSDLIKATSANAKAKRYLSYRDAVVAVKLADSRTKPEEFQAEAPRAIQVMTSFLALPDRAWESWPASRTMARLQAELGQLDAAATTLANLVKTPGLSPELRYEAQLLAIAAQMRAKAPATAAPLISELQRDSKFPASGPLRDRLKVLQAASTLPPTPLAPSASKPAEAVATLERAIADVTDPVARAVAYNFLGDLYNGHGFPRDAMWAYLWVDTVFSDDADERVHAIRKLAEVFEAQGDSERAGLFRDRLPTVRQ